jgi:hypothetical protein
LKQKLTRESELQKLIDELIVIQQADVYTVNDKISPQGELNQILGKKVSDLFPGIRFVLIEDNEYGESKSTMQVYYNDIEYKELSRSEKQFINVLISTKLMELKPDIKFPLLIDDSEMFSKAHIDKLEQLLANTNVEYIITKVCSCKLSFTTQ